MLIDFSCKVDVADIDHNPVAKELAESYREYNTEELCSLATFLLYLAIKSDEAKDVKGLCWECEMKGVLK